MTPIDFIIIAVVALIIGAATFYIIRAKRKGKRCIGCPYNDSCKGGCGCGEGAPRSEMKSKNDE